MSLVSRHSSSWAAPQWALLGTATVFLMGAYVLGWLRCRDLELTTTGVAGPRRLSRRAVLTGVIIQCAVSLVCCVVVAFDRHKHSPWPLVAVAVGSTSAPILWVIGKLIRSPELL